MVKGKLIIIEAGDGCGKATQTKLLYGQLTAKEDPLQAAERFVKTYQGE